MLKIYELETLTAANNTVKEFYGLTNRGINLYYCLYFVELFL